MIAHGLEILGEERLIGAVAVPGLTPMDDR